LNLVHFSVQCDIWWEQFYLFCKELTDQIQCSLRSESKKAWWHRKFKKWGLQVICERSEQEKIGALQNCHILFYAYFGILCNLPSKKKFSPSFQFLYFPPFFPEGICMEWTPLQFSVHAGHNCVQ